MCLESLLTSREIILNYILYYYVLNLLNNKNESIFEKLQMVAGLVFPLSGI